MTSPVSSYLTVAGAVTTETEISRSRFLCLLSPADDEDAARRHIAEARALHPRARHHCTAMVLGPGGDLQRTSDDGEPSGTAGAPMLEALVGAGVSDVVAVVVRYFGGVLLGTGGLARAYRGAVVGALKEAGTLRRTRVALLDVSLTYAEAALVAAEARRAGWTVDADYGAEVGLRLAVPPRDAPRVRALIERVSAGRVGPTDAGATWLTSIRDDG